MLQYNLFGIGYIHSQEYDYYMKQCAARLGMDWRHLDTYIYIESGRNLFAANKYGYYGLLQWGDDTAKSLGYSSGASLISQNNTYKTQFQIVEMWIRKLWKSYGTNSSPAYLYLCNFLPINAPHYGNKRFILVNGKGTQLKQGVKAYDRNTSLDYNKDGYITIADIDNKVYNTAKKLGYDLGNPPQDSPPIKSDTYGQIAQIAQIFAIGAIIVAITNEF